MDQVVSELFSTAEFPSINRFVSKLVQFPHCRLYGQNVSMSASVM